MMPRRGPGAAMPLALPRAGLLVPAPPSTLFVPPPKGFPATKPLRMSVLVPGTAPAAALLALVAGAAVPSTPPFKNPMPTVAEGVFEGWFAATAGIFDGVLTTSVPEGEPATAITGAVPAADSGRLITRPTLSLPLVRTRFKRASASGVTPN